MRRLLAFPAARRGKWIVFIAWLVVIVAGGPLGAKFESAQKNESTSFLPDGTDSLMVTQLEKQFPSGEQVPAVIVFARSGGLTAADNTAIAAAAKRITDNPPVNAGTPLAPVTSQDGTAALLVVPYLASGDSDKLLDAADALRTAVDGLPAGLTVKLGGPLGFSSDAVEVFANINGTLLIATGLLVFVLLILIYRSPIFWLIPLLSVFGAEATVRAVGYLLTQAGLTVNGQSAGILLVLVFGAGTDYALLLVSRYREELHHFEDRHEAMRVALTQAGPAIVASAGTVVLGLLCLALAQVNGTQGLGIIGAMGVVIAAIAMLTLLPVLLVICGRWVFWPLVPRVDPDGAPLAVRGPFRRIGEWIARRPRPVWVVVTIALLAMAAGTVQYNDGLTSSNGFIGEIESVDAAELIGTAFPAGSSAPTVVVVPDAAKVAAVRRAIQAVPGVAAFGRTEVGTPGTKIDVVLKPDPYSQEAYDTIADMRTSVTKAVGPGAAYVGGPSAVEYDLRTASARDSLLLPPIVLAVIFVILMLLLRSIVAPVLLIATVILSYFAALGVAILVFEHIAGFPGVDPSFPLFGFIFLVALGVDYNIFLMARVREESERHGTREGTLRGLAATGSVITSAGIVLAGTFAVLGVLPLVALAEIGFIVAFGVLLDTLIVRSILVPAGVLDLDKRTWWPSQLAR